MKLIPKVSVVVCTRNRSDQVVVTIKTLLANSYQNLDVILVDQSTNSLTEIAIKQFQSDSRFKYIRSNQTGVARARNLGLSAAESELVLYTDDDCEVPNDWVAKMVDAFNINMNVVVVFCNVYPAAYDHKEGFIPSYIITEDKQADNMLKKCMARGIGAGMGVRKAAVTKIGGFDNELGPGSSFGDCEDGDIAVRAILNGFQIYETSQTGVIHTGFRTWSEGKQLAKRNWVGIGAAYAKPFRCGYWSILLVILYEAFVIALFSPIKRLMHFQSARGLKNFLYFWLGFFTSFRKPVDAKTIRFLNVPHVNERKEREVISEEIMS